MRIVDNTLDKYYKTEDPCPELISQDSYIKKVLPFKRF